jgi:hypothetical protein
MMSRQTHIQREEERVNKRATDKYRATRREKPEIESME